MKELKQAKVYAKDNGAVLIGSVVGTSLKSWRELSLMVEEAGCDMVEINFGCPNLTGLKVQGAEMGADIRGVNERVRTVVEAVEIPVFAKLTSEESPDYRRSGKGGGGRRVRGYQSNPLSGGRPGDRSSTVGRRILRGGWSLDAPHHAQMGG
jgi:hypothetical protein